MCTVTLHRVPGRLSLTMNRDERRERGVEVPGAIHRPDGAPAWVGPLDGPSGGTWIGASERGLVACVLNAYQPSESAPPVGVATPRDSRGRIVPRLLECRDFERALEWLRTDLDPGRYNSFTLMVAGPLQTVTLRWMGSGEIESEWSSGEWSMWSSSSWRASEVLPWRRDQFAAWQAAGARDREGLPTFHLLQPEGMAEWSPLMSREKTATRSIARVEIAEGRAALGHWPVADSRLGTETRVELPLSAR